MAAISSNSTGGGDWSDGSTWVGGVAPVGSDTVTIVTGDTVVYDGDLTHTAPVTVQDGATLRGEGTRVLILSNTTLTVEAGGTLSNTGGVWEIRIGAAHSQAGAAVLLSGSSGSRVTVTGESTTNYIRFADGGFIRGGKATATYCDFARVGNTSNSAFQFWPSTSDTFSWQHCTFDADCGRIQNTVALNGAAVFRVEDCTFSSTGQNLSAVLASGAITTGTRSVRRNYFAGTLGTSASGGSWVDVTFEHNVMDGPGGIFSSSTAAGEWGAGSGYNLIRVREAGQPCPLRGTTTQDPNYWLLHPTDGTTKYNNCRWLAPRSVGHAIDGQVCEPGLTNSVGDLVISPSPGAGQSYSVTRNLVLPVGDGTEAGQHAGQFVSMLGNANLTYSAIDHNTYPATGSGGESGAVSYGETYAGHTEMVDSVRSNLVYNPAGSGGGYVFQRRNTATVQDGCLAVNISHNGKWGLSTGDAGVGYDDTAGAGMFSSGSPGADDVVFSGDPFLDSSRRISSWAVSEAVADAGDTYHAKVTAAVDHLASDPATRIPALIAWVQDGWRPTDPAAQDAGHDGVTIGALEGEFGSAVPVFANHYRQLMGG